MKKLIIGISLLIALLVLSMFAAIPHAHAQPTNLNTLVADRVGEPMDIDPAWAYDTLSAELIMNVYDTLLTFNRTNIDTFIPRLATSWTIQAIDEVSPEGLHWLSRATFTIRTGVHFQDTNPHSTTIPGAGAILTPQDVEYSFERTLVADAGTGPAWMLYEPLTGMADAYDLNSTLFGPKDANGFYTSMAGILDQAVESNATHVWFNLVMPYGPFLQVLSQSLGSIMNRDWCMWHNDWPGFDGAHLWSDWHDLAESPLYVGAKGYTSSGSGIRINAALGTGPYLLDHWDKGAGNSWSIIKNDPSTPGVGSIYWEGWTVPFFRHEDWGPAEYTIDGHVDNYTSNYIPEWSTRELRFLACFSDFCDVPRTYMGQVFDGHPGIQCMYPLPQLACNAFFFNFLVSDSSTYLCIMQPNSTFSQYGAPPNIMQDLNFRLAMAHMFDYATYLNAAWFNEAISPVTPIIPGLAYYDSSIGQPEDPNPPTPTGKEYGITSEPVGQLAYDVILAKTYLQTAWGGALWANGFCMDVVYVEGDVAGQLAATLMRGAFTYINANYGTRFTLNVASIPWSSFRAAEEARVMPLYISSWHADFSDIASLHAAFPDASDFARPFMDSEGVLSQFQGFKGVTSFPNALVDSHIDAGIAATDPSARQVEYTWLQQWYVDNAPGFVLSQPMGRHFQRDWVQGWYYNVLTQGHCIYDLWKEFIVTLRGVDVAVTNFIAPDKLEVNFPVPLNTPIEPYPSPVSVTVSRLDTNSNPALVVVIITVELTDASGNKVWLDYASVDPLAPGYIRTVNFNSFTQKSSAPVYPGTYTMTARVFVSSGFVYDTNLPNNEISKTGVVAQYLIGDVNCDGSIDMADISLCIDAFMSTPGMCWIWDIRCDLNSDGSVDMADISMMIDIFMTTFDP